MKNLILPLVLFVSFLGYSQSRSAEDIDLRKETKVESFGIVATVDSLEELESTFTVNDIKEMFDLTDKNQAVSFKLVCNGDLMSNGKKSNMSYKVEGTANEEEIFLKRVEKIRKAAIKYYQN